MDQAGTTALMIAAEQPDAAVTLLLLQHGADAQAVDAEHRTALFYAARTDQAANIAVLQRAGASLDVHDTRGYNALDGALAVGADAAAAALRSLGLRANLVSQSVRRVRTASSIRYTRATSIEAGRRWHSPCRATTRPPCSNY